MSRSDAITAMLRAEPQACARCSATTEYVCWWHPDISVCPECPCPECGDRESWLAGWLFAAAVVAVMLIGLAVADSIWSDEVETAPSAGLLESGLR